MSKYYPLRLHDAPAFLPVDVLGDLAAYRAAQDIAEAWRLFGVIEHRGNCASAAGDLAGGAAVTYVLNAITSERRGNRDESRFLDEVCGLAEAMA